MDARAVPGGMVVGSMRLQRTGWWSFPTEVLVGEDGPVAHLGRDGSLRIFFGPGRRTRLADGTEWRIKAVTSGRHIVPVIGSDDGIVALSGPLHARRSYGINGKAYGYALIPAGPAGFRRPGHWVLRHHDSDLATIDDRHRTVEAAEPVPVAAVLLAFTLISHGIPGEADLMPGRD